MVVVEVEIVDISSTNPIPECRVNPPPSISHSCPFVSPNHCRMWKTCKTQNWLVRGGGGGGRGGMVWPVVNLK
jgi:hypothetical protein